MTIDLTELELAVNTVTLPTSGGTNKLEPSTALKANGWDWKEKPSAENFNWLFYKIYKAIEDLDARTVIAGQLPVGSYYWNETDSRNPAILLGYGTWVARAGRTMVGAGTYTDSRGETKTFVAGQSGGEFQHVLTETELAPHTHPIKTNGNNNDDGPRVSRGDGNNENFSATTDSAGGGQPHNNMQPYIVAYCWVRVA